MNNKLYFLIILAFIFACTKEKKESGDLPPCIQTRINEILPLSSFQLLAVYRYKIDDEYHYWFNTTSAVSDYVEDIYDDNCNKVCSYCGACLKPECIDNYPYYGSSDWEVAWKP